MTTRSPIRLLLVTCAALLIHPLCPADRALVWWEGENPDKTNFPDKTWFSASTFEKKRHDVLSGGDWLTGDGKRTGPELFARYTVRVPHDGTWTLWCRKFWKHGPFRWRFDEQDWTTCGRDIALADTTPIRKFVSANWVNLGKVKLEAGRHTFELRLLAEPGDKTTACFDCFALVQGPFVPRGKLKPGEKTGKAMPGWWAFEPEPDRFGPALLDLTDDTSRRIDFTSPMTTRGDDLVDGSGRPIRLWAVNCGAGTLRLDDASQAYLVKRLAKVGVNAVRVHTGFFDRGAEDPSTLDPKLLDGLHRLAHKLRQNGIALKLSFYFPLWFGVKPGYGLEGYTPDGKQKPFAALFFNPRMQSIHRAWAKQLLQSPNPHTGTPLGRDPVLAMVEIVNEDSLFFWTFSRKNIPDPQLQIIETAYAQWLVKQHGSHQKARAAWKADHRADRWDRGRPALLDAWNMTRQGLERAGQFRTRMTDQVAFLADLQKRYYDETIRYIKDTLGYRGLVSCSNWKTADDVLLGPIERWTYTAGDVIDRHGYFGGPHKGPRSRYAVDTGDTFKDRSALLEPTAHPVQVSQVEGYPHIISELGWPNPNRFRAEMTMIGAAAGSVQGLDGVFFFAIGGPDWDSSVRKFPASVPTVLGQSPACSTIFRRRLLEEAEVVVRETLPLDALFSLKGSAVLEAPGYDQLRRASDQQKPVDAVDPMAFFVGRVVRRFDRDTTPLHRDLSTHINRKDKSLSSVTGQLRWDWGRGLLTLEAPRAQGVVGFLGKAGDLKTTDTTLRCRTDYASIVAVSMDDKPLARSHRVLVQVMTEECPYGWTTRGDKIVELGGYPMNIRRLDAQLTLVNPGLRRATVLNEHGYRRGELPLRRRDGQVELTLPPDAMYVMVE